MKTLAAILLMTAMCGWGQTPTVQQNGDPDPDTLHERIHSGACIYNSFADPTFMRGEWPNRVAECTTDGRLIQYVTIEDANAALAAKDAEIAKLKRELAAAKKKNAERVYICAPGDKCVPVEIQPGTCALAGSGISACVPQTGKGSR